jgi:gliding motility associated protien GldN
VPCRGSPTLDATIKGKITAMRTFLLSILLPLGLVVAAQNVLDGAYIKEHAPTRRAMAYSNLREADVMIAKRVWRTIDLRQRMNHLLFYPLEPAQGRCSLFDVIKRALLVEGTLTAYDPGVLLQDDSFSRELTVDELRSLLEPIDTMWTPSLDDPDLLQPVVVPMSVSTVDITRYQIKEEWYFDKQRGMMDTRIIGLAPLREVCGENGELRGHAPLFWLYYPELRHLLANAEAFDRGNDGARHTYEQVFEERLFSSYIIKESNVHDRRIGDHLQGLDALLEAERTEQRLFEAEHDLWNH